MQDVGQCSKRPRTPYSEERKNQRLAKLPIIFYTHTQPRLNLDTNYIFYNFQSRARRRKHHRQLYRFTAENPKYPPQPAARWLRLINDIDNIEN